MKKFDDTDKLKNLMILKLKNASLVKIKALF